MTTSLPSFDAKRVLEKYQPKEGPASRCWDDTRDFVIDLVDKLRLQGPQQARYAAWVLSGIAAYAVTTGTPLDVERVLHPAFVDRYVAMSTNGPATAGTLRTLRESLRRYGCQLTTKAPWEPRAVKIGRSHLAPPYTASELATLLQAIDTQSALDRQALRVLYFAGLGWGLDGRWATDLKASALGEDAAGLHITVGQPDRTVTCLINFERQLADAVSAVTWRPSGALFEDQRQLNSLLNRVNPRLGKPGLRLARLRTTWLCTHLDRHTPVHMLMIGAGLATPGALTEVIRLMPTANAADVHNYLRGM